MSECLTATNGADKVRKLQRALYRTSKQDKKRRFYSLYIRFRRYLTQRSKGRGFGWKRFPNSKLYAMGLVYIGSGMLTYRAKPAHDVR